MMPEQMKTHLDICSGIGLGGFSLAAGWAGYTTIGFCEIDPWCRRVLAKNFPGVPMHDDLKTLEGHRVRQWIAETEQGVRNEGTIVADAPTMQRTPQQRHQSNRNHDESRTAGLGSIPQHDDLKTLTAATVRGWIGEAGSGVENRLLADAEHARRDARAGERAGVEQRSGWTQEPHRPVEPAERGVRRDIRPLDLITGGYPCQPFSLAGKRLGAEDDRHLWPFIAALVADLKPRRCLFENVYGHVSMGLDAVLSDLEALGYACGAVVIPAAAVGAPHRRDRVWILADAERSGRWEPMRANAAQGALSPTLGAESAFGIGSGSTDVSDAMLGGQPGPGTRQHASDPTPDSERETGDALDGDPAGTGAEAERGLGLPAHGLPGRTLGRSATRPAGWHPGPGVIDPWAGDWEAGMPRTVTHEQDRTHKLKALGNSIVPQVAYEILRFWGQP